MALRCISLLSGTAQTLARAAAVPISCLSAPRTAAAPASIVFRSFTTNKKEEQEKQGATLARTFIGTIPLDMITMASAHNNNSNNKKSTSSTAASVATGSVLASSSGLMVAAASTSESWLNPTMTWWLESCVGIGGISLGLPGLAAQVMFLAPMSAMSSIKKAGTTDKMPLLPYTAMMASGFVWAAYGFLLNNPAIWLPNIPALVMGAYYSYTFAKYVPSGADWLPSTKFVHAAGVAAICAGTTAAALTLDTATAVNALGILGDGIVIAMFGGPLVAIKTVLAEKSTRSLPFAFTIASFVNCALWSTYGIAVIHDPYIWLPNVLGLASAVAQLGLFARFGFAK